MQLSYFPRLLHTDAEPSKPGSFADLSTAAGTSAGGAALAGTGADDELMGPGAAMEPIMGNGLPVELRPEPEVNGDLEGGINADMEEAAAVPEVVPGEGDGAAARWVGGRLDVGTVVCCWCFRLLCPGRVGLWAGWIRVAARGKWRV